MSTTSPRLTSPQDVLGAVVDGNLSLAETKDVVADALWALGSQEIRLSASKGREGEDEDLGGEDGGNNAAAKAAESAKGKLIGKIARKNLVENVVPIMIALKSDMEKARSPMVGQLMRCLREVVAQYKSEAADLFAADPRLASEIEYDMRRPLTPGPVNQLTPTSNSVAKATRRRTSMTPGSMRRCVTPASKRISIGSAQGDIVMPSPAAEGAAVRQWNVVPTPGKALEEASLEAF